MVDLRELFEEDAMERYKVPLWLIKDRRDGESYNIDSSSILSHLHWEWQAWKRCFHSVSSASLAQSDFSDDHRKMIGDMRDLALEIREATSAHNRESNDKIIRLYDTADTVFGEKNILSLLHIIDVLLIAANRKPVTVQD